MELIDLELVTAVAETGSITHGAARARLSLPAASGRIRALERALGVTLFDRGRRGVTVTPAGQLLLRHARAVGHSVDRLRVELGEYTQGHGATVRVQANTAATASVVPAVAVSFLTAHPAARIDLEERPSHRIVAAVAEHRADLGIVADSVDLGQLHTRVLRPDPLVVVTVPDDPLTRNPTVAFADVVGRAFVGLNRSDPLQEHVESHARPLGTRPTYRVRLPGIDIACRAVAAGIGIAVLPRHSIQSWLAAGTLAAVPLTDPWADRRLVVCYTDDRDLSETARALRDHLSR
ncbi:LysR family transcriptional regulator [Nocardia terpenica]|uniref:LysR family transcriptional regulator n=1 Tax=Nocardia terpenica TaxID=455432 RepID=UPI00189331D3|nr:LysR family transcriptional regulator [Nocardia terpenica]MBF6065823.1 LysR family transcriptional regulator [Nocardia terpenica]MBF6108414.1 LysR family transcriptional regulator [Nocardia terpenica]MBF6115938.1 LysR family transcriptional regulator [Nocardia terpenica]MBF6123068.1 LysR family transcriptional regulator [Nocardia terpenica]MBF6156258.1 LysR family transcriptional regulator [Nocardia terpenica]